MTTPISLSSSEGFTTSSLARPSVKITSTRGTPGLASLKSWSFDIVSASPVFVLYPGCFILSIAVSSWALVVYWLKLNWSSLLDEKTIAPTLVSAGEITKALVNDFTKSKHFLKFPFPYISMLPEPSITKPRSTCVLQAENNAKQEDKLTVREHA